MARAGVWVAVCALLTALAASPAAASVAEALGLTDLVHRADEVALTTTVSRQSRWENGEILTDVTLRVNESYKGAAQPGDQVVVTHLGGSVGRIGMTYAGMPSFPVGERALVFARRGKGHALGLVGMSQGVMRVRRQNGQDMVLPGAAGMTLVQRAPTGALLAAPAALMYPRPLADVVRDIRAVVQKERTK